MRQYAYAKINLGLRILRKREDGYHDIETVFHRIAIRDELSFSPSTTLTLEHDSPSLPHDDSNLILRTARHLQEQCAPLRGARITLRKKIPIGAGLGGGSADAAATLLALNSFWKLNLSMEMLRATGSALGADVPYFLRPGSAYALGKGEILQYFDLALPYWVLTVFPGVAVPTAWAYRQLTPGQPRTPVNLKDLLIKHVRDRSALAEILVNDFDEIVSAQYPAVGETKSCLLASGAAVACLSGSGSSVYGFFESEPEAKRAAERFGHGSTVILSPPNFIPPH